MTTQELELRWLEMTEDERYAAQLAAEEEDAERLMSSEAAIECETDLF